jgi:hypothetical protein
LWQCYIWKFLGRNISILGFTVSLDREKPLEFMPGMGGAVETVSTLEAVCEGAP